MTSLISFEFKDKQFLKIDSLLSAVQPAIEDARVGGMFSIANFYRQESRNVIEGFRLKENRLSRDYGKEFTRGKKLSGQPFSNNLFRKKKAFQFLAPLVRFRVFARSGLIVLGFGTQKNRFDRNLTRIGKLVQSGYTIDVTQKMRSALALTGEVFLKKSTTSLKVEPRPIFSVAVRGKDARAIEVFRKKAMSRFSQRLRKAS